MMINDKYVRLALVLVLLAAAAFLAMLTAQRAGAGIGPEGFAHYARQGILHGIQLAYGAGNNPYTVHCQDHPNYVTLADNVTCQIRLKS